MTTTAVPGQRVDPALRRLVWVLVLGALAPALDTTIVNVALATLGRELHVSVATSQWAVTGYLLAMGMAIPVTGWLSERFGGKQTWLFALTLFLAGSVLSGAAWNIGSLIVFRIVQGTAAGLIMPIVTTLLVQAAGPKRLGGVMAIAMLPVVVVPVFGPVVGGLLLDELSWRWIFFVNIPLCVAAVLLAARAMPSARPKRNRPTFDGVGLALLSPGLALTIYGLSQVNSRGGFAPMPGR